MSEKVPAWKKLGLKVQEALSEDPLALTTHLAGAKLTKKEGKALRKQQEQQLVKRKASDDDSTDKQNKKSAKRVKLPKNERPPPPVKDQLTYLKQYSEDKDNWKFSKQKQNWILKNIRVVPKDYEKALYSYLEGLQGGSRKWVVEDMRKVIDRWNVIAEEAERKVQEKLLKAAAQEDDNDQKDKEPETEQEDDKKKLKTKPAPKVAPKEEDPDYDYAVRCREIVVILDDEKIPLRGVDFDEEKSEPEAEQQASEATATATETVVPSNLIVDHVDIEGVRHKQEQVEAPPKKEKKAKKDKKSKKDKQLKSSTK